MTTIQRDEGRDSNDEGDGRGAIKSPLIPIRIKPRTKPAIYERHCRAQPMEHVAVIAHTVRTSEPSSMRKMANQREGK